MIAGKSKLANGFTLIELLIVISIIAVLSSLALVVLRDAQETARHARTRTIIAACTTVLQKKIEDYESRPLPFRMESVLTEFNANIPNLSHKQHLRRRTVMEWIYSEIPTSWSSLQQFPSIYSNTPVSAPNPTIAYQWYPDWKNNFSLTLQSRPTSYLRGLKSYLARNPTTTHEDAELLYAIMHNTWDNGIRATEAFRSNDLGDLDKDGCPEILDAWGKPLTFIVWIDINKNGFLDGQSEYLSKLLSIPANALDSTLPLPPELTSVRLLVTYEREREN